MHKIVHSKPAKLTTDLDQANPTFFQYPSIWSLSFRKFKNLSLVHLSLLMLRYSGILLKLANVEQIDRASNHLKYALILPGKASPPLSAILNSPTFSRWAFICRWARNKTGTLGAIFTWNVDR